MPRFTGGPVWTFEGKREPHKYHEYLSVFLKNQATCYADIRRSGMMIGTSVYRWRGYQGNREKGPLSKA